MGQPVQIGVKRVQFGQQYRDTDGELHIADQDVVLLTLVFGGTPRAQARLTPEQAFTLSVELAKSAGQLMADAVTDDGTRVGVGGFIDRVAALGLDKH